MQNDNNSVFKQVNPVQNTADTGGVVNSFNSSYTLQRRAMVIQQKTDRPVQFEITKATRETLAKHIKRLSLRATAYQF